MKKVAILWGFLMILITGTLIYIGLTIKNKNNDYLNFEKKLETAANDYDILNDVTLNINETYHISLDMLTDSTLIKQNKVNDDECDGYVVAKKGLTSTNYTAYIKCENYETSGYDKNN